MCMCGFYAGGMRALCGWYAGGMRLLCRWHRTPGTLPPTASPTRGDIPQRLRPRRRIASRASPTRQAKDTSRACPSPARRRIPISGHKIPILTIGYLPPPLSGGIRGMGQPPCTWRSAPGPLAVRCQRHSDNHTPNHTGRVILPCTMDYPVIMSTFPMHSYNQALKGTFTSISLEDCQSVMQNRKSLSSSYAGSSG